MVQNSIISIEKIRLLARKRWIVPTLILAITLSCLVLAQQDRLDRYDIPAIPPILGLAVSWLLSKNSFKGNFFNLVQVIFTDFSFEKLSIEKLAYWLYFFANVVFWTSNIDNFIFTAFSEFFLYQVVISLGLLLIFRFVLQLALSIVTRLQKLSD